MGVEIAVGFAVGLMLWILPSLWWRLSRLTLIDMFLLGFVMFFGAYTVIDVTLLPYEYMDALTIVVVFLPIVVTVLVLWTVGRGSWALLRETSLTRFHGDCVASPAWAVICLITIGLLYRWGTAQFFYAIPGGMLREIEREMPYWLTSIGLLTNLCAFSAGVCAWAKARGSCVLAKIFWYAMLAASAFIILGMGRRAIFALMVMIIWDIIGTMRAKGRQAAAITVLVLSVPALVAISNMYQLYRLASWRGVPVSNAVVYMDATSIIESAADINRMVENLQDRSSIWRFNYEVAKAHLDEKGDLQLGRLFLLGFSNFVPLVIYPDKEIFDTEGELLRAFHLEEYDRSENLFTSTYGDFGLFSVIVSPVLVLLFVAVCVLVLRWLTDPFLRALLLGAAIFYAINVEASYHVPVGIARDFVVIGLAYVAIRSFLRAMRWLVQAATLRMPSYGLCALAQ